MWHHVETALVVALTLPFGATLDGQETVQTVLEQPILSAETTQSEVEEFCRKRVPLMPPIDSPEEWKELADSLRAKVLSDVVLRGEAQKWKQVPSQVVWGETIPGGDGYKIRKLRFEALPGLWIPALLYEPNNMEGLVPVVMNVNGHDRKDGKAAPYKQARCINQAKRGMLALNVEWLGMGQLNTNGFGHYRMNQLDLCGTSGLAPFYLAMSRGLDVLLAHKNADPKRVAVAGLSGGGWQTIIISALDTRVTLCNPVAGYSSFLTRIDNHSDLGDSEQTPCDLATVADYTHLTAMLAPRAALLTYNVNDNCCFASGHALQPLLDAARPAYKSFGKVAHLNSHVNHDPGTHNFERDNREALYRMFSRFFSDDVKSFSSEELDFSKELKTKEELSVELPATNLDFHQLAQQLSIDLPVKSLPSNPGKDWRNETRARLASTIRYKEYSLKTKPSKAVPLNSCTATPVQFVLNGEWTVPAVEFSQSDSAKETIIVLADAGRSTLSKQIEELVDDGKHVLAVDYFYTGESKIKSRDFLFALMVSAVGERPLGIQTSQLSAIVEWSRKRPHCESVTIMADGERASLTALMTSCIVPDSIDHISLKNSLESLKEIIDRDYAVNKTPEFFCFGLLNEFDISHLKELAGKEKFKTQE